MYDPGPGTLAKCASSRPQIDLAQTEAIVLTHRHIDHSTDVNVIIEAISNGGFKPRGVLLAPEDCLDLPEPVVFSYVREFLKKIEILKEETNYRLGNVAIKTTQRLKHPVETYGIIFASPGVKIGFISDTEYFEGLAHAYRGCKIIVINVVRLKPHESGEVQHLCLDDAKTLVKTIKPAQAVLTHFGMTMLRAKPWEIATAVTQETGIKTLAASDGMTLDLSQFQ